MPCNLLHTLRGVCLAIARRYFTHFNVILAHANRIFSVR